jgi:hypothetical protein
MRKNDLTLQQVLGGLKETKTNMSNGRIALSKSGCRYELPMDLKLLESELPLVAMTTLL